MIFFNKSLTFLKKFINFHITKCYLIKINNFFNKSKEYLIKIKIYIYIQNQDKLYEILKIVIINKFFYICILKDLKIKITNYFLNS